MSVKMIRHVANMSARNDTINGQQSYF